VSQSEDQKAVKKLYLSTLSTDSVGDTRAAGDRLRLVGLRRG